MIYMQYARGTLALSDEACAAFLGTVEEDERRFSHACVGKPGA